jgi:hypothetical protein
MAYVLAGVGTVWRTPTTRTSLISIDQSPAQYVGDAYYSIASNSVATLD